MSETPKKKKQTNLHLRKISIYLWPLRDEIESIIQAHPDENDSKAIEDNFFTIKKNVDGSVTLPLRRTQIEQNKVAQGSLALNEIDISKCFAFSEHKYVIGQTVMINFCIPIPFAITAEVIHCRHTHFSSKIIQQLTLSYRIGLKFLFERPGEKTLLREFLESIHPYPEQLKKIRLENEEKEEKEEKMDERAEVAPAEQAIPSSSESENQQQEDIQELGKTGS